MKVPSAVTYVLSRALWLYLAVLVVFAVSVDYKKAQYKRARYLLGVFYNEQLQNYSDGIVYFDYLSQLRPKEARNYFLLGYCYLYLQQYDKALIYFKRALVLGPGNPLWEQYLDYAQSKAAKDGRDVRIPEGIIDIPLE
ncbi:MAG: tetratricopeptide repeat protein [Candidatus Omnitrophica bacterium]|nr:tetratricopeptide repeat protein [Candidatus Omnitrophota bacterium]